MASVVLRGMCSPDWIIVQFHCLQILPRHLIAGFYRAALNELHDDLFFSPGYNTPLFCRSPFVFTIHDLSHVYCPEISSPLLRLYYATVMKRSCGREPGFSHFRVY